MSDPKTTKFDICVVGCGFSGLSIASHVLRMAKRPLKMVVVDPGTHPGRGVAYSTPYDYHLLNVPVAKMSAFEDEPSHFLDWVQETGGEDTIGPSTQPLEKRFAPRRLYGEYLSAQYDALVRTPAHQLSVTHLRTHVHAAIPQEYGFVVRCADQSSLETSTLVIATGNAAPADLGVDLPADRVLQNPWAWEQLATLAQRGDLLIVGTGLTMIDVLLTLQAHGHAGRITAVSRRGLLPQRHQYKVAPTTFTVDLDEARTVRGLVRQLRTHIRQHPDENWRAMVDSLRPVTQQIWKSFTGDEKSRFVRHPRPFWEVHRHRIAPELAEKVDAMCAAGRLEIMRARLHRQSIRMQGQKIAVELETRLPSGNSEKISRQFDAVVNCTGPGTCLDHTRDPLLRSLRDAGLLQPDPLGLGVEVTDVFQLRDIHGNPSPRLHALGPMCKAAAWEITAVPDIRKQTQQLAAELLRD